METTTHHGFLSALTAEVRGMSRSALIAFGVVGLISALQDLMFWPPRPTLVAQDYVEIVLLSALSSVVLYGVSMRMIGQVWSWTGLVKFAATMLLILAPLLLALVILVAPLPNARIPVVFAATAIGLFALCFLPGWPLAQATSPRWVSPTEAWKATRGLRQQLFLAAMLLSAIHKMSPDLSAAQNLATASLMAVGDGFVTSASLMVATVIAVLAWRHMQAKEAVSSAAIS